MTSKMNCDRLKYLTDNNQLVEAQRLEQRTRFDLEMIQELVIARAQNYSRYRQPWRWRSAADVIPLLASNAC